ncbi:MAG: hypothetical protein C4557_12875 [Anaerolineaceae bacterium]|jgi:hypothetical protein|nr:MAG: hypothetical protein C4557_12875 [Anaerolineaceae bacterium]
MKTIRRLYFYAVAFISIEVVLWGAIGLLRSIIGVNRVSDSAFILAQALSLILVGVPIFLFHWWWAQNSSTKDEEERTASLRAIFLYGILLGTLIPVVQNLLALIDRIFLASANLVTYRAIVGGSQTWVDNLIAIVINLLIAAYFWNILKSDWRATSEQENFAEIRRLYRFVWMLYGLLMAIYGAQQALDYAFTLSSDVLGGIGRETVVNAIALLVVGTPIWYFSWRILQDALPDSAEKESYLRLGILYLLALGGVIIVLTAGGNLLYMIFMRLFGDDKSWADFLQDIGGPISIGVPFAAVWAYYGAWLNRQFAFDENAPRRAGKQRLYFYILSFLGLAATFYALASLLSVLIDLATDKSYLGSYGFSSPISSTLAALLVGLPLWLLTWRPMQAQALAEGDLGDHARRSVIRKSYLYLVLFISVIGGMASAGALVFTLINAALGGSTYNFANDILNAVQNLVLFVVLLLYHLSALRRDGAARADALGEKQSQFKVLVFDYDGKFGEAVKAAFARRAPKLHLTVINAGDGVSAEVKADAVILPGSVAVNLPEKVEAWIRSFGGSRLIVNDEAAGVFWMNDFGQAADSAKALAEGQEIRPQSSSRTTSVWTYAAYVFAALFACQLLFMLLMLGVSMVTGF